MRVTPELPQAATCVRAEIRCIEFDPVSLSQQNNIVREAQKNICSLRNTFAGCDLRYMSQEAFGESLLTELHAIRMSNQLRLHLASFGFLTVTVSWARDSLQASLFV